MAAEKADIFITVENHVLESYSLNDRQEWKVGRFAFTESNAPDIRFFKNTVSREHGIIFGTPSQWNYRDNYKINGTCYNGSFMNKPIRGNGKPKHLKHGDIFVFGNKKNGVIGHGICWGLYLNRDYGEWLIKDCRGLSNYTFTSGKKSIKLKNPAPGRTIDFDDGFAIYDGEYIYYAGNISITCS